MGLSVLPTISVEVADERPSAVPAESVRQTARIAAIATDDRSLLRIRGLLVSVSGAEHARAQR